jgi:hypothetical protein
VSASSSDRTDTPHDVAIAADQECPRELRLFAFGIAWLTAGVVVYMTARPPTTLQFLPHFPNLGALVPGQLRPLLGSAPTFVHVVAFSLMSASIVGRSQGRIFLVCGGWALIEISFELAQYPTISHWLLQRTFFVSSIPHMRAYLVFGTFDYGDVLAAIVGAALAAVYLTSTKR